MDMNNVNIEEIVKQVLSGMTGTAPAAAAAASSNSGAIPKTARVAVLTEKEHFELKEYPIPPIGDDDILVKVEGCGVCGTDAHEFKRDPFNLIPVALGHEGTGEIVAMGKNVKVDTAGKPVKVGDKVVTCMIFKDDPDTFMSYQDFKHYEAKESRLDKVCFITSNKKFTKGHRDRVNFANKILKNHIDFIDVYGNGYNPVDDKLEVMSKYKYVLAIENGQCMDYWTEKLADSYLAGCYPTYYGCPNISDYFKQDSMLKVDIRDYEKTISAIKKIIDQDLFSASKEAVSVARNLVLDKYNMFNLIANEVNKIDSYSSVIEKMSLPETIYPMKYTLKDLFLCKLARLFNITL